jgi:hypothetical protein
MAKQHQTTLRFDVYSMGKLANVIWGEGCDVMFLWGAQPKCHLVRDP